MINSYDNFKEWIIKIYLIFFSYFSCQNKIF
jgi:hypothetical protein